MTVQDTEAGVPIQPYRLVGRLKNNRLWTAILERWPDVGNQAEAARRLGIPASIMGNLLNCKTWPHYEFKPGRWGKGARQKLTWTPLARHIEAELFHSADYLFDPALYGKTLPTVDVELVYDPKALAAHATGLTLPPSQEDDVFTGERRDAIRTMLRTLAPREELVIRKLYGLDTHDGDSWTLDQVADFMYVSRERVRQVQMKALQKLRHPARTRTLRGLLSA
jgi:RNA polymerase sigma factor (sigma-70 family)